MLIVPLLLSLTSCVLSEGLGRPNVTVQLPKAPEYYLKCFESLTPIPVKDLNREMVIKLVAELRQSEVRKSRCGKDLLIWYATVQRAYGQQQPQRKFFSKPLFN